MKSDTGHVPAYAGNPLIEPLGPIMDEEGWISHLTIKPTLPPDNVGSIPRHIRVHQLMSFRSLHIPMFEGVRLAMTIDLMIRQGYVGRVPTAPGTWRAIYGLQPDVMPPLAAAAIGCSGVGKTTSIRRCLARTPQKVRHAAFPQMADGIIQLIYLVVEVPANGGATALAAALHASVDQALGLEETRRPTAHRNPMDHLDGFVRRVSKHFLGILCIDEIENLFKLQPLKARRSSSKTSQHEQLAVADDVALKWIVNLCNSSPFPVLVSGTADSMDIMSSRLSTAERLTTGGFHQFNPSPSADDPYAITILTELCKYQWFKRPLPMDPELGQLVHKLSAGVPRIRTALWFLAHRHAFERGADGLELRDFQRAADIFMAPLQPAVKALLSKDPDALRRYEDLLPNTSAFWASLFRST